MINTLLKIFFIVLTTTLSSNNDNFENIVESIPTLELRVEYNFEVKLPQTIVRTVLKDQIEEYALAIRQKESTNNYENDTNPYGYLGAYQFSLSNLKADYGVPSHLTKQQFLKDYDLQDRAFNAALSRRKYMLLNWCKWVDDDNDGRSDRKICEDWFTDYIGTTLHGVYITESGLLASCHLVGVGGTIRWMRTGVPSKDGNGVSNTEYIQKYNGYNLDITPKYSHDIM
jgi:hypothetical protein